MTSSKNPQSEGKTKSKYGSVRQTAENIYEVSIFAGRNRATGKRRYITYRVPGTRIDAEIERSLLILDKHSFFNLADPPLKYMIGAIKHLVSDSQDQTSDLFEYAFETMGDVSLSRLDRKSMYGFYSEAMSLGYEIEEITYFDLLLKMACQRALRWGHRVPFVQEDRTMPPVLLSVFIGNCPEEYSTTSFFFENLSNP